MECTSTVEAVRVKEVEFNVQIVTMLLLSSWWETLLSLPLTTSRSHSRSHSRFRSSQMLSQPLAPLVFCVIVIPVVLPQVICRASRCICAAWARA